MMPATKMQEARFSLPMLAGLSLLGILTVCLVQFPLMALGLAIVAAAVATAWQIRRFNLDLWQILVLTALAFYIVFNYGFDNLAFRLGPIPFIVGDGLMFAALGLVVLQYRGSVLKRIAKDPALVCLLVLLALSIVHLVSNVSRYGLYAFRDASMYVEALFFFLGSLWAREKQNTKTLLNWLMFVFIASMLYNALFPFAEKLQAISPQSGIFKPVPIIGTHADSPLFLVLGALFCLWLGKRVTKWPRWLLYLFAMIQIGELGILQTRSTYVGLAIVLTSLLLLGEIRRFKQLSGLLIAGVLALLFLILAFAKIGVTIPGRVGPVDTSFLEEHAATILVVGNQSERWATDDDRLAWYQQVWQQSSSTVTNLVWGQGFGEPLIDFISYNKGAEPVRQPHNSTLSVFARLGACGLAVWLFFNFFILRIFFVGLRGRVSLDDLSSELLLWLFFAYLLFMITSSVQPLLEFSHGAVPFFFLMGFAQGLVRWQGTRLAIVRGRGPVASAEPAPQNPA